jgi:hypothetical protein
MKSTNFKYYEIDLADVWEYEREKFIAGETNEKLAQKLLDLIQPLVGKIGHIDHPVPVFIDHPSPDGKTTP